MSGIKVRISYLIFVCAGKKKVKGRTVELGDFLMEGEKPVQAGFVVMQKKIDWADDNNYSEYSNINT